MPSIAEVTKLIPAGMTLAQWLASRRGVNRAVGTLTTGATQAGVGIKTASQAAIDAQNAALAQQRDIAAGSMGRTDEATAAGVAEQRRALDEQRRLAGTSIEANRPYAETGSQGIAALQGLIEDPYSVSREPGYQFGLSEGEKAQQRLSAARGTAGGGRQIKEATRYALDYASTKYNDAWNRLLQSVGVGERANAANVGVRTTLGSQEGRNADAIADITRRGDELNNLTMGTLGTQIGTTAERTGDLGIQSAEDEAALTLAQAELQAREQAAGGIETWNTLQKIAEMAPQSVPTIANIFKKAAPAVAGAAIPAVTGAAATGTIGALSTLPAVATIPGVGVLAGGSVAAPAAFSGTAAGGAAGGGGLLGLGSMTIPVVGGIIAGGVLLANHFIGQGRKAADKLTGKGGIQHAFEDTLNQIDAQPEYTEAQKWESKVQAYDKLVELALAFAKKGQNERKVVSQMFDTIAPLFGHTNPLKGAA